MAVATEISEYTNGRMKEEDYDKVQRKILASKPPFAHWLENQMKFCRVWGGGQDQKVVKDICEYIKMCETIVKVSGHQLKLLSEIKCLPGELIPRFIAACVKATATRGLDLSQNDIGTMVSGKEIKMITGDLKQEVIEANELMKAAIETCYQLRHSTVENQHFLRGNFECDLVEHVFSKGKYADKEKKPPMTQLVVEFTQALTGKSVNETNEAASHDHAPNIFDATSGDATEHILARHGLKHGAILEPKSQVDQHALEKQYEVNNINDDGSLGISSIHIDGTTSDDVIEVKYEDICKYKLIQANKRIKEIPVNPPPVHKELDNVYRMVADTAMYIAYDEVMKKSPSLETMVRIQQSPRLRLLARRDLDVAELTMLPWSDAVKPKLLETTSHGDVTVKVCTKPPKIFQVTPPSALLGKTVEVPFWRMAHDKQQRHTNMKWSTTTRTVPWPVDIGLGKTVEVVITTATNCKAIKANREIRIYTQEKSTKRKGTEMALPDTLDNAAHEQTKEKKPKKAKED